MISKGRFKFSSKKLTNPDETGPSEQFGIWYGYSIETVVLIVFQTIRD